MELISSLLTPAIKSSDTTCTCPPNFLPDRSDIGNPAPLGFFAFSITLGLYMCVEAKIVDGAALFYVLPLA